MSGPNTWLVDFDVDEEGEVDSYTYVVDTGDDYVEVEIEIDEDDED